MKLTRKQRKNLIRIIIAFILLSAVSITGHIVNLPLYAEIILYLLPFFTVGYDVVIKAVKNIGHGQIFDENLLMTIATVGAMLVGEYSEGAAVMLFYQVGELFQSIATSRSRKNIAGLMDIKPDSAVVLRCGNEEKVHPSEVAVGESIVIRPGEKVPLDCVILKGESSVDTSALTGESLPTDVSEGGELLSGSVNLNGVLVCRAQKPFGESTVSKILELVENASSRKAKAENFITKFARIYTPAVVAAAVLLAAIPPLVTGQSFSEWAFRALTFLVVSCPCALVISVPMSFFGGIGGASKQGILIKGGSFVETLSKVDTVIFDKTGTLTKGSFSVTKVTPCGCTENELIEIAAAAERGSNHPIAQSLKAAAPENSAKNPTECKEISGKGVRCVTDGKEVLVGNIKLMEQYAVSCEPCACAATAVYTAMEGKLLGTIEISDTLKPNSKRTVASLKKRSIKSVILTGDSKAAAETVAGELAVDEFHAGLLPGDKVNLAEKIISESNGSTAFVGDGINDAPVLSRADVGIAMGAAGSDAAIEAADIVLMDDDPFRLISAIEISRKTLRIVYQNIVLALGIKGVVLVLSALGFANMWAAVFADVGVAVLAILNAMRMLKPVEIDN